MKMMSWEFKTHYIRENVKLEPLNLTHRNCGTEIKKKSKELFD
jgi:hypothetical protein